MPAYDYRCTTCGCQFEVTRAVGEKRDEPCPECGGSTKRVFSPVGVVFKGSGFHNTDYRPRPAEQSKPAEKPSGCSGDSGSSACASCPASSD